MITAKQCKAARAVLGWSHKALADRASVGSATVYRLENRENIRPAQTQAIAMAISAEGVMISPDGNSIGWSETPENA